jgi:hypothetical protein
MPDRRPIRPEQIDFSDAASTPVMSDSLRFVLPVPALEDGGEPLVQPDGAPLLDRRGAALPGKGVVFFDRDDQCWEAARGDGQDVVIFSPIDETQAGALAGEIAALARTPADLTLAQIKRVIAYAYDTLGLHSAHASTRAYVAKAMAPAGGDARHSYGLFRRKASDVCRAVYLPGAGAFLGVGGTPQRFGAGAVIVKHGDEVRLVQCVSFEATYRFLDGRRARVAELATQTP